VKQLIGASATPGDILVDSLAKTVSKGRGYFYASNMRHTGLQKLSEKELLSVRRNHGYFDVERLNVFGLRGSN
jgi:hypothetical protein